MKTVFILILLSMGISNIYAQETSLIGKTFLEASDLGLFDCSAEILYDYDRDEQVEYLVLHVLKEKDEQECYKGNMTVLVSTYFRNPDGKVAYYTIVGQKIFKTLDTCTAYTTVYDKMAEDEQRSYLVSYKEDKKGRKILSLWSFDFSKREFIAQEVKPSMEIMEEEGDITDF